MSEDTKQLKLNKYDEVFEALEPQHGWILVATERGEEQSAGGLYLGSPMADMFSRVVAIGPGVTKTDVKPGDYVSYKDGIEATPKAYFKKVSRTYALVYELNIMAKVPAVIGNKFPRVTDGR